MTHEPQPLLAALGLVADHGPKPWLQSACLAPREGARSGSVRPLAWDHSGVDPRHEGRWPGHSSGIRGPMIDETPLSYAEVAHAMRVLQ